MPAEAGSRSARPEARSRLGRVASAGLLTALLVCAVPATPAGAATPTATGPRPGLCARVQTRWARLVLANQRAKAAFLRASALQDRLERAGRSRLGHRLDIRLQYLRQIHAILVDRVRLLAARAAGVCSGRPPVLDSY